MDSLPEDLNTLDRARIRICVKKGNKNYMNEYLKNNKCRCTLCDVEFEMTSKRLHVESNKHQLKVLKSGGKLEDSKKYLIKVKKDINATQ